METNAGTPIRPVAATRGAEREMEYTSRESSQTQARVNNKCGRKVN